MANPYKTREGGATVTVFVPYDCRNNCPFCINKQEYADMSNFSLEKICESIERMDRITPYCDFVFSGGEPMADLESLQKMLDKIPTTHRVFVNTTLPVYAGQDPEDILRFLEKNKGKITCINISRHMQKYVEESPDELIGRLPLPRRINCVLYKKYPSEKLPSFVERWKGRGVTIQFRYDYTDTTPASLYREDDDNILHDLKKYFTYKGLDGCRMRNGYHFEHDGMEITYHKTLPYSTIVETDENGKTFDILYDIIIKQTGELHSDWTGVPLDVERYENVTFEPSDQKWIERF